VLLASPAPAPCESLGRASPAPGARAALGRSARAAFSPPESLARPHRSPDICARAWAAEYIVKKIPVPVRDFTVKPTMIVIRSFDVNKPGEEVKDLRGGVAGGSILQGVLRVGDEIEIRPGIVSRLADGSVKCVPLFSKIKSLYAEHNDLQFAVPGGLIGVGTLLDPTLTRADRLVGQVLGAVGHLPEIYTELEVNCYLLRRLLGVKTADGEKQGKVQKLAKGETLMVNIGSTSTGGRIGAVKARANRAARAPTASRRAERAVPDAFACRPPSDRSACARAAASRRRIWPRCSSRRPSARPSARRLPSAAESTSTGA